MDNKKENILKAALELFVNQGFHATPTSQIAFKAGVANGTIFHYFKTKEELINILYLETKDNYFIKITEDFDSSQAIIQRFHLIWINTITWAMHNSFDFRFLQLYSNSPFISQLTQEQISRHVKFFHDQLEEGIKNNIFKKLPVSLLFQITLFHIYGFIFYLFENQDSFNNKKLIDLAFKSFWDSLCDL
jgi:AcrR family transcriptional regulator